MRRTRNLACILGRFNPFHFSHLSLVEEALSVADTVAIILGSHNQAQTTRNPFTSEERERQILACFPIDIREKFIFIYAEDFPSNAVWAEEIKKSLLSKVSVSHKTYLIEFHKDERTKGALTYLRVALNMEARVITSDRVLSSTHARRSIFLEGTVPPWIPAGAKTWILENFIGSDRHRILSAEYEYLEEHFAKWSKLPRPVSFQAADAFCFSRNKVLLIRRNSKYGHGLLAIPGGMLEVDRHETLLECALRELREETWVFGVEKYLINENPIVFDNPWRSLRGRVISNAFRFDLPDGFSIAKTSSEASEIVEMDLEDLDKHKSEFFEDHYYLIRKMQELH